MDRDKVGNHQSCPFEFNEFTTCHCCIDFHHALSKNIAETLFNLGWIALKETKHNKRIVMMFVTDLLYPAVLSGCWEVPSRQLK